MSSIQPFLKKKSLGYEYAKFVAVDGWSFHSIANSKGLRLGLAARKFCDLPKCPKTIKNLVMKVAEELIQKDKEQLSQLLKVNTRFALTFDEWTSARNRRFMNLVLHYGDSKIINLGLHRVTGNATSVNLLQLVCSALDKFGLDLFKHIICIMTDGCAVMTKLGALASPVFQQLCYAHAVQLSVLDVLYVKEDKSDQDKLDLITENFDNGSDEEIEDFDEDWKVADNDELVFKFREEMHLMVKSVRCIVKYFRRFLLANEKLQDYVQKFHGKELEMILDCKTR